MTFKDRHALDALPARIGALQSEVARVGSLLADPDLYARDKVRFATLTEALGRAQDALATAEEQWLALELLREEIEG
jgi:ATP-binding cassette subfamily F protein uup